MTEKYENIGPIRSRDGNISNFYNVWKAMMQYLIYVSDKYQKEQTYQSSEFEAVSEKGCEWNEKINWNKCETFS